MDPSSHDDTASHRASVVGKQHGEGVLGGRDGWEGEVDSGEAEGTSPEVWVHPSYLGEKAG